MSQPLHRLKELLLPAFRPERVRLASYDLPSHDPTRCALQRYADTGRLPAVDVPGSYAQVVYEECALDRHGRVDHVLNGKRGSYGAPKELPGARMLALIELEAYLTGITTPYDEIYNLIPGLLALPDLLEKEQRTALAADVLEVARQPTESLEHHEAWLLAACAPALLVAAGAHSEDVASASAAALERKGELVRSALDDAAREDEHFDPVAWLASGGALGVETECDSLLYRAPGVGWDGLDNPIYGEKMDEQLALIRHWSPEAADALASASGIAWMRKNVTFRVAPLRPNPLWFLGLTLEEQR